MPYDEIAQGETLFGFIEVLEIMNCHDCSEKANAGSDKGKHEAIGVNLDCELARNKSG